jgi:hypothetical protein
MLKFINKAVTQMLLVSLGEGEVGLVVKVKEVGGGEEKKSKPTAIASLLLFQNLVSDWKKVFNCIS